MEQLTIFDAVDETKTKLYEVFEKFGMDHIIQSYHMYKDYYGEVKYFYVRTAENIIIDMCISTDSKLFAIHEHFNEGSIKKVFTGRL
ncbi:hypothetical protein BAMA_18240 [Bacillus manliponensis]|uniref:Uncharacterized protein n=1 Tax=Bacillus manliponensis TaxID=574376 RepID=A0A073JSA9_9BACI|nr:hypothetical protein [Bacillus manliponensis]KEK17152.1 hypothetical protein BAMA_18240 [Bacillus manliponensis]